MFDKRWIFVFFSLLCHRAWSNHVDSSAIVKFDIDTVDFGKVYEGDTVIYDFWFTNIGSKDLHIKQAWPSCGCTYPTFTQGAIKPGGRGKIHVEFRSSGFGGHDVVKQIIIISFDAPESYANFKAHIVNKAFEEEMNKQKQPAGQSAPVAPKAKKKKSRKAKGKNNNDSETHTDHRSQWIIRPKAHRPLFR